MISTAEYKQINNVTSGEFKNYFGMAASRAHMLLDLGDIVTCTVEETEAVTWTLPSWTKANSRDTAHPLLVNPSLQVWYETKPKTCCRIGYIHSLSDQSYGSQ